MKQVFLSYARADSKKAKRLYNALCQTVPFHVWFDGVDLLPGVRWEPAIRKAIRESDYFLAVLSHESVSNRGFRHTELREALEVAKEFPDNWIFLIPTRLNDCRMPLEGMEDFNYLDLFPKWGDGVHRLCRTLKAQAARGKKRAPKNTPPDVRRATADVLRPGKGGPIKSPRSKPHPRRRASIPAELTFQYKVGLVDLGERIPTIGRIAQGLNGVQSPFQFTRKRLATPPQALTTIDHRPQLYVPRLPGSFYERIGPLETDYVICLTRRLLALEEGKYVLYNYLADQSPVDPRVFFISYAGLDEYAGEAGVTLDTAMAYLMTAELVNNFLDLGYHKQIRNCPMDFTEDHSMLVGGLRAGRFCRFCSRTLKKSRPFGKAFRAMIAWGR